MSSAGRSRRSYLPGSSFVVDCGSKSPVQDAFVHHLTLTNRWVSLRTRRKSSSPPDGNAPAISAATNAAANSVPMRTPMAIQNLTPRDINVRVCATPRDLPQVLLDRVDDVLPLDLGPLVARDHAVGEVEQAAQLLLVPPLERVAPRAVEPSQRAMGVVPLVGGPRRVELMFELRGHGAKVTPSAHVRHRRVWIRRLRSGRGRSTRRDRAAVANRGTRG